MLAPSVTLRRIASLAVKSPSVLSVISKTWVSQQLMCNTTLKSAVARSAFQNIAAFSLNTLKDQGRAVVVKIPALFIDIESLSTSTTAIAHDIVKNCTSILVSAPEILIPSLLQTHESAVQDIVFSKISNTVSDSSITDVTMDLSHSTQSILPNIISGSVKNFISGQPAVAAPVLSKLTELPNISTAIEQCIKTASKATLAISADIERNTLLDLKCLRLLEPDSTVNSLTLVPRKFPTLQEPLDFGKVLYGKEPEFIKNLMEYLYSSGNYLCGLAVSACHLVSTALYNSYNYLYNFVATTCNLAITAASLIKDVAVYTYNGLSYIKDFATFCIVDHPYIVTGTIAFAASAYLIKKYHLLDYVKTTAEIGYYGIETAVQIGCNTTVAAFSGVYYLVDSAYSACQKTWEYFSSISNDYNKDSLENDYTEFCFCEY